MFTRALFPVSARKKLQIQISRYVTRTIYSCFLSTDEEAAASKRMEIYIFLRNYEYLLVYLPNKKAYVVYIYYTVIKHDGHLRTRGKCRKHEPQASAVYISRVLSNDRSVLSQYNTQLRLLHLLYDIDFTRAKQ